MNVNYKYHLNRSEIKSIEKKATDFFEKKAYHECIEYIHSIESKYKLNSLLLEYMAQSNFYIKNFSETTHYGKLCLKNRLNEVPFIIVQQIRGALQVKKDLKTEFYKDLYDDTSKDFVIARDLLQSKDFKLAKIHFAKGVNHNYSNEVFKSNLLDSFDYLLLALEGKQLHELRYQPKNIKKIFVSGMGWSGSGALYDYFKEFANIEPISDETPYIEGVYGLIKMLDSISDLEVFSVTVIDFFFYNLLGHGRINNIQAIVSIRAARKYNADELSDRVSLNIKIVTYLMSGCISKYGNKTFKSDINIFINETIDRMSIGKDIAAGQTALLDNIVHIQNVKFTKHMKNAKVFCTFRDARSNYVALKNEHPGFIESLDEYIASAKRRYKEYITRVETAKNELEISSNSYIEKVQFEDFVMLSDYREELANIAGLEIDRHREHMFFKPSESEKNVFLHERYVKQIEIEEIKSELSSYCIDLKRYEGRK